MEFTITKSALQKEMGFVQGIVEKKNTIPALSNILVESSGEKSLRITATDFDVTIRCQTEAQIIAPGSFCVQARKLFDIARLLPESDVSFKAGDNDRVAVVCQNFQSKVAGIPRSSYPEVPTSKPGTIYHPAAAIKRIIDSTIFAITQEESRYTLSGAKFMASARGLRMVTTDGHRLAFIEKGDFTQDKITVDTIIPRKTLAELAKLTSEYEGEVGISADENHIYFEIGRRLLITRALTGQFPNYDMVIPKDHPHKIIFEARLLTTALRRVALMSNDKSHAIRMQIKAGYLHIDARNEGEGEAAETVTVEYVGDEQTIGFNAQYLQDFLGAADCKRLIMRFKDPNSQVSLEPEISPEEKLIGVVMPMRVV
jgi:DNA polymerase III subunit beta